MEQTQTFQTLNTVYQPIYSYVHILLNLLKERAYNYTWGFYNNHTIMIERNWAIEYYPIPVITINGLCDIGIDIDHIFIECKLGREQAISFDWNTFSMYSFEVYGVEDYLNDFYSPTLPLESISQKIMQSTESQIAIAFHFAYLEDPKVLIDFIEVLHRIIIIPEI